MIEAMKNLNEQIQKHGGWWIVVILAIIATFYVLGGMINHGPEGFAHEVAAAFVGAILTVAVTAFLLRQQSQSAAQLQKDANEHAARLQSAQVESAAEIQRKAEERAADFQKELLKAQVATEEQKEKSVKIYEAKLKAYEDLMNTIEEIVRDKDAKSLYANTVIAAREGKNWHIREKKESKTTLFQPIFSLHFSFLAYEPPNNCI